MVTTEEEELTDLDEEDDLPPRITELWTCIDCGSQNVELCRRCWLCGYSETHEG